MYKFRLNAFYKWENLFFTTDRRPIMTEENYNYRTSQTLLRNQFPGKGKLPNPHHSQVSGKSG